MSLEVNGHVSRLRRFQPFQPDSAELIYEQTDPTEQSFRVSTLSYLEELIERPQTRLIVLTGDAGHGKTSLCARLLEQLGRTPLGAADAIRDLGDASAPVAQTKAGRPLSLLVDLSALETDPASALLVELLESPADGVAIVCANEGHLRSSVAADESERSKVITQTLEAGIEKGTVANATASVYVINLNYQSVAPDVHEGLVDWAANTWGADRRRWRICQRCDARTICPILANHEALADDGRGAERRKAIRQVFSAAERTGAVVTTRQALALTAHSISGGLICEDVHRRYRRDASDRSWQFPYLYHQALFGDLLTPQMRRQVPAFRALRRLDPGGTALRWVDDTLDPETANSPFLPPVPSGDEGSPKSRTAAQRESELLRSAIAFLRRLDYFEGTTTNRMSRLGVASGDEFLAVNDGTPEGLVKVRDALLRGLEAVQGVHRAGDSPDFLVLDPAFFSHRSRAAVIAKRIPGRSVEIVSQNQQWINAGTLDPEMPHAVEWASRSVYIRLPGTDGTVVPVQLDLLRFELLIRWAAGLSSRGQHEAEIRSLTSALAALAPNADADEDIGVLVGGERRTLTIDVGDRIRSGGA
ncbi:ATP-binding protein [Cellulomonas composti]|uniref:Uncharacterized protein n=1 Tax=Cellulomonas composti TaxID=266130 RepID=A0A511JEE1_9CELL|nr:ATP-binding protein [Cellulomonas composti]GEL96332.1 hypothetical protein CCO02nite_29900 [Cellulomonas composti]